MLGPGVNGVVASAARRGATVHAECVPRGVGGAAGGEGFGVGV
jgi:hypothetical protein